MGLGLGRKEELREVRKWHGGVGSGLERHGIILETD